MALAHRIPAAALTLALLAAPAAAQQMASYRLAAHDLECLLDNAAGALRVRGTGPSGRVTVDLPLCPDQVGPGGGVGGAQTDRRFVLAARSDRILRMTGAQLRCLTGLIRPDGRAQAYRIVFTRATCTIRPD